MSTEVAVRPEQDDSPQLAAARHELAIIRQTGAAAVERNKALNTVARMLEGCQWGNVKGSSLSASTRYALARICDHYAADPLLHIHILGGGIYLNAQYYAEQINSLPNLTGWHQNNISASYATELRQQAERAFEESKKFEAPELKAEALALLAKARYADERRSFFSIPAVAIAAYETVIEFTDRASICEANYAPNSAGDPVGKARPAETARTRSLRRAGAKASPRLRSLEESGVRQAVNAEYEIVSTSTGEISSTLQIGDGGEVTSPGEIVQQAVTTQANLPEPQPAVDAFDYDDARKKLMATFSDAGIKSDKDRKSWLTEHGFPASTKEFTPDQYRDAWKQLVDPTRQAVRAALGGDEGALAELSLRVLEKSAPAFLKDWKALLAALEAAPADDAGESEQSAFEDL